MFQHTAARRRLPSANLCSLSWRRVSTHSRAEAAARTIIFDIHAMIVSTHSRAEAAAAYSIRSFYDNQVSTHSRAEAAALLENTTFLNMWFQHTAARRRLQKMPCLKVPISCFNTQPRGGGCSLHKKARKISVLNTVFR